jgi:two-component system, LytTR family, response regulator AlgR
MNDPLRLLIVDDEPPARDRLRRLVAELPGCTLAGEAETGLQALDAVARLRPDVVLMDIRMPGMDGLEAARHLARLDDPPAVDLHDRLRPVRGRRVRRERDRLPAEAGASREARGGARQGRETDAHAAAGRAPSTRSTHFAVRARDQLKLVPVEDVYCCVADQKYVTLHHAQGEDLIEDSLRSIEDEFGDVFVRVHRNALVAVRHVEAVERDPEGHYRVRLRGNAPSLDVSRRLATDVLRRLGA